MTVLRRSRRGGLLLRKAGMSALQAGARVLLIAPVLTVDLAKLAAPGQIVWQRKNMNPVILKEFFIVICATNDPAVNAQAQCRVQARRGPGQCCRAFGAQ